MLFKRYAKRGSDMLDGCAIDRHVGAMTPAEILSQIQQLPFREQSRIYEALKELLRQAGSPAAGEAKPSELAHAARALRSDYESDSELTAFTALDSEDFHAAR